MVRDHLLMRGFMDGYRWEGDEDDYEFVHGISTRNKEGGDQDVEDLGHDQDVEDLGHDSDASQCNALNLEYPEFGDDPRNIRLGASTDGVNPFGSQSSTHSTWPVFVWMYNLPLVVHEEEVHSNEYAN
ncbi:hypothetical protein QYE76_016073 [Lolium multiflorum]|uniref:Uncharacterized protein n=1 Tax=Lolium multiflorum TaxID=4521 RepID=A0AAD8X7D0_LOLMU|nr:hypothetical protein QYE76_016073 [Lolium multiflorum]